ncbi:hypothetical protein ACHAQA_006628 [Verticillium albo-atrum]
MSQLPLQGKVAIITGASRGLGAGMALELATQGADASQALLAQITSLPHHPSAHSIRADLSLETSPATILSALDAWLGPSASVDILVNNAAIELNTPLASTTASDFHALYNLNVLAPLLLTQALLPRLRATGHNRIINIGSVGARLGFANLGLYCSSKAALEGLTRCWAAELGGDGTTVNQVNPGPVQSDMLEKIPGAIVEMQKAWTPVQNRLGTVEEVARVVAWLASPASSWVTGQVVSASGGFAMY